MLPFLFYTVTFVSSKRNLHSKCLKAVWVTSEGGFNSILFIQLFCHSKHRFSGLKTKTAGLKPLLHQLTPLSYQLSKTLEKFQVSSYRTNSILCLPKYFTTRSYHYQGWDLGLPPRRMLLPHQQILTGLRWVPET